MLTVVDPQVDNHGKILASSDLAMIMPWPCLDLVYILQVLARSLQDLARSCQDLAMILL